MTMRIVLAADHAGFELKQHLGAFLRAHGFTVEDLGAPSYNDGDDYPEQIAPAAQAVSDDPDTTKAIVIGGSGQGEAIVANRFSNVRAVVYVGEPAALDASTDLIALTRTHNDANVLSLGARFLTNEQAETAVSRWLETPFSGDERHQRRIKQIESER